MHQSLQYSMRINLSVVLCMNGDFWESLSEQEEIIQISPSLYFFFFFLNIILFIYLILFLAVLSLHCFVWAFSTCVEWELLSIGVSGLLIVVASHCSAGSRHSGSVVPACMP